MKQLRKNLYIGNREEVRSQCWDGNEWSFVLAAKTFHKSILGYTGNAAPKDENYLFFKTSNALVLNLIDAKDPRYISKECIKEAILFIDAEIRKGKKVLVACDQGKSRSAGICFLYMHQKGLVKGFKAFKKLYPETELGEGMKVIVEEIVNNEM